MTRRFSTGSRRAWLPTGLALLLAALLVPTLRANPWQDQGGSEESSEGGDEEAEEEDATAGERWLAVVGGEVHTGTGEILRGATVLAKNGKIKEIGYDVIVPEGAKVLEARGLRVYPGIVAISSSGLLGDSSSDLDDTIDPFGSRMVLGLSAGITSTGVGNGAAKLKRFSVDGVVLRDKVFTTFSWSGRNPGGKRSLREKLEKASAYLRRYRDWEDKVKKDKELKEPSRRGVDTAVLSVLRGESTAKFVANDRDDILGIARIASEYGFRPVIEGCVEGWTVADELGRAGAFAVVTPRDRRTKDERRAIEGGSSIENAAILHRSGVPVAVVPGTEGVDLGGIVGRDIMHIAIEADFAVRGGLPEEAALEAITVVPARILGISHRVGTLEVGKDCDLIVTDGDLLHYRTFVQYTVVDGKLVYDKEKELFFAHIRPRPAGEDAGRVLDKGETVPEGTPGSAEEGAKDADGDGGGEDAGDEEHRDDGG